LAVRMVDSARPVASAMISTGICLAMARSSLGDGRRGDVRLATGRRAFYQIDQRQRPVRHVL
jgi:hypothetical protein